MPFVKGKSYAFRRFRPMRRDTWPPKPSGLTGRMVSMPDPTRQLVAVLATLVLLAVMFVALSYMMPRG